MARLSEVLGGILKDVTQSRVTADLRSEEVYRAYREHPLLSRMPIPRMAVREVSVRLRFAIEHDVAPDYTAIDLTDLIAEWKQRLAKDVLPRAVVGKERRTPVDAAITEKIAHEILAEPNALPINEALRTDSKALVQASVDLVLRAARVLSAEQRKHLPGATELKANVEAEVAALAREVIPSMRRTAAATSALAADLDIIIDSKDLAKIADQRVQEITLTIGADDIQLVTPQTNPLA